VKRAFGWKCDDAVKTPRSRGPRYRRHLLPPFDGLFDLADGAAKVTSKGHRAEGRLYALGIGGNEVVFRIEGNRAVLARTPTFLDLAGTVMVPARNATWRGTR
jgi:antitoxin PrlF